MIPTAKECSVSMLELCLCMVLYSHALPFVPTQVKPNRNAQLQDFAIICQLVTNNSRVRLMKLYYNFSVHVDPYINIYRRNPSPPCFLPSPFLTVLCDPTDLIWREGTPFEAMNGPQLSSTLS